MKRAAAQVGVLFLLMSAAMGAFQLRAKVIHESSSGPAAAAPQPESTSVLVGNALIGVDHLGRVLLAVDTQPTDGTVDRYVLYTGANRLAPQWGRRLSNVVLFLSDRRVRVLSAQSKFAAELALDGAPTLGPYPPTFEVFADTNGGEIAHGGSVGNVQWADLDVSQLYAGWPESFYYDSLAPETKCNDADCISGGQGARSCTITSCAPGFPGCGVTCNASAGFFACCKCEVALASCRCRYCDPVFEICD